MATLAGEVIFTALAGRDAYLMDGDRKLAGPSKLVFRDGSLWLEKALGFLGPGAVSNPEVVVFSEDGRRLATFPVRTVVIGGDSVELG